MAEIEVLAYENDEGQNAFEDWTMSFDRPARSKVLAALAALARMKAGNFGDVKAVGKGVRERRINWGPGLRIYFGRDGQKLILLLGGGTKSRQHKDITAAQNSWAEYKKNKRK